VGSDIHAAPEIRAGALDLLIGLTLDLAEVQLAQGRQRCEREAVRSCDWDGGGIYGSPAGAGNDRRYREAREPTASSEACRWPAWDRP
jgi:hypothetical protein